MTSNTILRNDKANVSKAIEELYRPNISGMLSNYISQ